MRNNGKLLVAGGVGVIVAGTVFYLGGWLLFGAGGEPGTLPATTTGSLVGSLAPTSAGGADPSGSTGGVSAAPGAERPATPAPGGGAGGAGGGATTRGPAGSRSAPPEAVACLDAGRRALAEGQVESGLMRLLRVCREWPGTDAATVAEGELAGRRSIAQGEAQAAGQAGDDAARHVALSRLSYATVSKTDRDVYKAELDSLAAKLYFSNRPGPSSVIHVVEAGDTLSGLGRRYGVPHGFIKRVNGLRSNVIRLGQRLKMITGEIGILVIKHDFRLIVTLDGRYLKQYDVGTGKDDRTPQGEFVIDTRLVEPTWYGPDGVYPYGHPKNILGTRWLGFAATEDYAGFGIHGTPLDDSIGTASSMGCVRMHNGDVEELYDLVPSGTRVLITR